MMTIVYLICTFFAVISGLYFGKQFAEQHQCSGAVLSSALFHGFVSVVLVIIVVFADQSELGLMWMLVGFASMLAFSAGTLLNMKQPKKASTPQPQKRSERSPTHPTLF